MSCTGLLCLISVITSCGCYTVCAVCLSKLIYCTWTSNRIYLDLLKIQYNCNGMTWTRSRYCGVVFSSYRRAATTWPDLVNSSYLFLLAPKYLPQHPSLEHPVPMFLPKFGEPTVHACIENDKIIVLYILIFLFLIIEINNRKLKLQDVNLTLLDISVSYC